MWGFGFDMHAGKTGNLPAEMVALSSFKTSVSHESHFTTPFGISADSWQYNNE